MKLDIMIEIYIKMLIWIIIGWKDLIVDMKKIIGIKVEKIIALVKKVEIIFIIIIPNNDISNNIGFNEFEKTIQKMAKLLVLVSSIYTGEEKDRQGIYEIKKY